MNESDRGKSLTHHAVRLGCRIGKAQSFDDHELEKRSRRGVYNESQLDGLDIDRHGTAEKLLKSGISAATDHHRLSHSALGLSSVSR